MTQPRRSSDELLAEAGRLYRASLPQRTPEEAERDREASWARLSAQWKADLDAENAVACTLCLTRRPRIRDDEPLYCLAEECVNARKPWHYHRVWNSKTADQREKRRHRRRLRRGRLPQTPSAEGATT
ncbi:hypothetical protein ACLGIH_20350 [Streptomyces sp. HMX87]|uniref:hypothetical protein n=1 Tax=Streptomyces sp. HMX87 TaxID=3390849 RepID=UPI003A8BD1F8